MPIWIAGQIQICQEFLGIAVGKRQFLAPDTGLPWRRIRSYDARLIDDRDNLTKD